MFHRSNKNGTNYGILPETLITTVHFLQRMFRSVWFPHSLEAIHHNSRLTLMRNISQTVFLHRDFQQNETGEATQKAMTSDLVVMPASRRADFTEADAHSSFCSAPQLPWGEKLKDRERGDQTLRAWSGLRCQLQWTAAAQVTALWDHVGGWCSALCLSKDSTHHSM